MDTSTDMKPFLLEGGRVWDGGGNRAGRQAGCNCGALIFSSELDLSDATPNPSPSLLQGEGSVR
jgi:hypothetical protein